MTSSPVKRPATYEDLLKVPEDRLAEIVDGDLYASPRPAMPHSPARTLEVLRAEGGRWVVLRTFAADATVRAEPFDAIELDLLPLWGETRPPSGG